MSKIVDLVNRDRYVWCERKIRGWNKIFKIEYYELIEESMKIRMI